jgi:hypothetical protein
MEGKQCFLLRLSSFLPRNNFGGQAERRTRFRGCSSELRANSFHTTMSSIIITRALSRMTFKHHNIFKKDLKSRILRRCLVPLFLLLCTLGVLSLSAANAETVTLAWDPSAGAVAGYKVYYGTNSGDYKYSVNVGNINSCTISGLTEGTTYYLAATAYNTNNVESSLSKELVHTIASRPPPSPVYMNADGISDSVFFAINAGGPEYVDTNGTVYMADTNFSGGKTYRTVKSIGGTQEETVYQSERYGDFSYDIPVPNGNYIVTLKFAEIYWRAADRRRFDVEIQGNEVVSNLDIFATVGQDSAIDVDVPVSVLDGVLKIDFFTDKDNAKVSGIKILK